MDLRSLIRFLRTSWLLIGAFAIAGGVLAGGYVAAQAPQYEATAKVYVSTRSATSLADVSEDHSFTQGVASSFASLVTAPIVLDPVIEELGLHETAAHLASRVRADVEPDTVVIDLTTRDSSPARSAEVSNAVGAQLAKAATRLAPSGSNGPRITVVSPARPPLAPTYPSLASTLVLGLLAGIALGLIAARLRNGSGGDGGSMRAAPAPQLA